MPRRLLLALLLLVAAPLVLLGWVSASTMASAQQLAQTQLAALLRSRLSEINGSAIRVFDRYTRELTLQINESDDVITDLRRMRRTSPIVRQGLFVSSTGQLLHPAKPNPDDADAVALYAALPGMISGRSDLETVGDRPRSQQASKSRQPSDSTAQRVLSQRVLTQRILEAKVAANNLSTKKRMAEAPDKPFTATPQWQIWYLDRGIQLILWIPRPDGTAVGVLLDRPRWTADLTAELPDSQTSSVNDPNQSGFTALVDESKQIVYRWGAETLRRDPPTASIAMSSPLSGWQWEFHSADPLVPRFSMLPIVASLAGIGVLLIGLGGYVLSSVQRQMRSARNRVSFAGQVSHELRTPLTNIRLYAELAQSDLESLPESKPQASLTKRLGVIESESKRLSRLVSGVLEMIRDGKRPHGPRLERHCPDELINETLQQFAPSFQQAQITVHCDLDAPQGVDLDADLFEMVLVNLLSNAEKYAAAGEYVGVRSRIQDDTLIVSVQDRGPGIPKRHRAKIFQPFARLDNSISAPSGTGIGLTIATNAARRQGGTLRLVPSDSGSLFELRIPVQANSAEPTTQPPGEA